MAQQGVTTGADLTVVIQTATQGKLSLGQVIDFDYKETISEKSQTLLTGRNVNTVFSHGWEWNLTMLRDSPAVEAYFKKLSKNRKQRIHEVGDTVIITVREASGAITRHTFTECKLVLTDAGKFDGANHVMQKVHAKCTDLL